MGQHSTILFLRKGGKKKSKRSGKTSKEKKGRLYVGKCLRDHCKVFYQPSDDANGNDDPETGMGAMYRFETSATDGSKRREPSEGEIAWLPEFDPRHIQSTKAKEREEIHKKTLYDAYRFLNESDDRIVEELKHELNDPNHRRWQSWFVDAVKWKDTKMRERARNRAGKEANIRKQGLNPKDFAHLSGTDSDSAYESDSDDEQGPRPPMGPPPLPHGGSAKRPASRNGRGGPTSKQRKTNSSANSSGSSRSSLGKQSGQRARGDRAPGFPGLGHLGRAAMFEEGSEAGSDDIEMFMSGASSGDRRDNFRRLQRGGSARVLDGSLPEDDVDSISDTRPPEGGTPLPRSDMPRFDFDRMAEFQEGNYEEALQEALRQSVEPQGNPGQPTPPSTGEAQPERYGDDAGEEERAAVAAAVRASLATEYNTGNVADEARDGGRDNEQRGQDGLSAPRVKDSPNDDGNGE